MLWSILICGVPERYHLAQPLLYSLLEKQSVARSPDIELLYLMDNRRMSVGAKRNLLLGAARGEYLSFIDDDDMVADDYVKRIYGAFAWCKKQAHTTDVVCFPQRATLVQEQVIHECRYSLTYAKREPKRVLAATANPRVFNWTGPPAHTMIWRREIAQSARFPDKQFGEDCDWVDAVCARAETEYQIEGEPLYAYIYNSQTTATRG